MRIVLFLVALLAAGEVHAAEFVAPRLVAKGPKRVISNGVEHVRTDAEVKKIFRGIRRHCKEGAQTLPVIQDETSDLYAQRQKEAYITCVQAVFSLLELDVSEETQ